MPCDPVDPIETIPLSENRWWDRSRFQTTRTIIYYSRVNRSIRFHCQQEQNIILFENEWFFRTLMHWQTKFNFRVHWIIILCSTQSDITVQTVKQVYKLAASVADPQNIFLKWKVHKIKSPKTNKYNNFGSLKNCVCPGAPPQDAFLFYLCAHT